MATERCQFFWLEQSCQHEQNGSAAQRVVSQKQRILALWEARVRETVPAAKKKDAPALRNSLPTLLDHLAAALSSSSPNEVLAKQERTLATEHGQQRAKMEDYSLDQVIAEYQTLRQVLVTVVGEDQPPLPSATWEMIHDFLLVAIRNAATEFTQLRDRDVRQAKAEIEEAYRSLDGLVNARVAELRVTEERFRNLVEAVKDYSIFTVSPSGYITTWNAGCVRMKGYSVEEAIGKHFSMLYTQEGRRRDEAMAHLRSAAIEGRYRGEGVRVRKNQEHFLADVSITPIYEGGTIASFATVVQDLTERNLLMQERDLSRSDAAKLRDDAEFREQFVANLTHDLRTPLAAAKACAELVSRSPDKAEKVADWAGRIVQSIDRTDKMISEVLDATRLQAGKAPPLTFEKCDLAQLAIRMCEDFAKTHGNRFTSQKEGDVVGYWNEEGLRRIFENLLTNAVKYGDAGKPISVRIRRVEHRVLIMVHNDGTVIPVAEQQKLFNPYHRTDMAEASGKRGWGIGLALVKGLVEAHKGIIRVESYPKEGTTFTVDLPFDTRVQGFPEGSGPTELTPPAEGSTPQE